MSIDAAEKEVPPLDPAKFHDPEVTADGSARAKVALKRLETLWFNTGTLCNLTCVNCYIESSPTNDRLVYITAEEVRTYVDEIRRDGWTTREIGFTGGEPFMNPEIIDCLEACLFQGLEVLVLTNGMRPMTKRRDELLRLNGTYGRKLKIRVSLDHYTPALHELERGAYSWEKTLPGLKWLSEHGFRISVAGRTLWAEPEDSLRAGYAKLFAVEDIGVDAWDQAELVLFPEMDETIDVPEITKACWGILGVDPDDVMCATSRMVVKRKGADRPVVLPCTLLPYDTGFELGETLAEATGDVALNHPHCAKFCVLGGGSCSIAK